MNAFLKQIKNKIVARTVMPSDRNALAKFAENADKPEEDRAAARDLLAQIDSMGQSARAGAEKEAANQHAARAAPPAQGRHQRGERNAPQPRRNAAAAAASALGEPFHNPYTFIPFATSAPAMRPPTLLSADETDPDRFTGLIKIRIRTLSPLLSCDAAAAPASQGRGNPRAEASGPKHRLALTAGGRFIVPATGIRGAMRSLLTIMTGARLGPESEGVWLCQGRDLQLGPGGQNNPNAPPAVFLARVVSEGSSERPGRVELNALRGRDVLTPAAELRLDRSRPNPQSMGTDSRGIVPHPDGKTLIKLSGRPVNPDGKREGLFQPSGTMIDLPGRLWAEYAARHRSADYPELRRGDLVWLEHVDRNSESLTKADEVASIQWARWGRKGRNALDLIGQKRKWLVEKRDGVIDMVADLFGYVEGGTEERPSRAGRVRPDNLVFDDGTKTTRVELAVLAQPHPGCLAFYRDIDDLDAVGVHTDLRGYKVYRTTNERDEADARRAPWHYSLQGEIDRDGRPKDFRSSNMAQSCELIQEGSLATLTVSVRSLSREEVSYLLASCSVDWRLGGGKPLGLGHCRPVSVEVVDEFGSTRFAWQCCDEASASCLDRAAPAELPEEYRDQVNTEHRQRLAFYQATQRPVQRLRYPRLTTQRANGATSTGGHTWFQRLASPKKSENQGKPPVGLQVLTITGQLRDRAGAGSLAAQPLPGFNPARPFDDVLYGYGLVLLQVDGEQWDLGRAEAVPPVPNRPNQGPQGQNAATRRANRDRRD
jgi:hypothetical protein